MLDQLSKVWGESYIGIFRYFDGWPKMGKNGMIKGGSPGSVKRVARRMRASSLATPTPTPPPERPRRPVERPPRPAAVSSLPVAKVRTSRAPPAARAAAPTSLSRSPAPRRYDSHRDDSRARSWRRRSTPDTHRADGRVPAATRYSRTTFEGKRCRPSPFPPPAARDQLPPASARAETCRERLRGPSWGD